MKQFTFVEQTEIKGKNELAYKLDNGTYRVDVDANEVSLSDLEDNTRVDIYDHMLLEVAFMLLRAYEIQQTLKK